MSNKDYVEDKKKKKRVSLTWNWEQKIIEKYTPKIPHFLNGYNLTLLSIPISFFIIIFGFLAKYDFNWLWGVSVMIALQWFTDSFDGAVGRYRNSGLKKWGFYMDHFLDYVFLCSILIAYSFIVPDHFKFYLFFILAIMGGYMVNAYLAYTATGEFKIDYLRIGPTEARIIFVIINTLIIFFGKTYMAQTLPFVLLFSFLGLFVVVYRTQKFIYNQDMKNKIN